MKTRQIYLLAFVINVFFLSLCFVFGSIQYGAIDDFYMAAVLTGAHGHDYNAHLLFVNVLYGNILIPLYKIAPTIGWYYLGEVLSVFLSLFTISFVIIKNLGIKWGSLVALVFVALTSRDLYLVIQFTQCAYILSAAGILLFCSIVAGDFNKKRDYLFFFISVVFLWWGSIMRWQAFCVGMPFFALSLLALYKNCLKCKKQLICGLIIFFAGAFSMHLYDLTQYQSNEYRSYTAIQGPRSALGDYANYDIRATEDDIVECGKSENDFYMLRNWMFYDTEIFKPDSIAQYLPFMDRYRLQRNISELPHLLLTKLCRSATAPLFWLFFLSSMILFISNKNRYFISTIAFGLVVCYMLYLIFLGRLVYRVEFGLWLYAIVCLIVFWRQIQIKISGISSLTILVLLSILFSCLYIQKGILVRDPSSGRERSLVVREDSTNYKQVFSYMNSHKEKMFFVSMEAYKRFSHHIAKPYEAVQTGSFSNIVPIGFWTPYLPEITESLNQYGVSNPLKDVVKDNVIVYDISDLSFFLQEHYFNNVKVDTVLTIGQKTFFKYRVIQ